ncbi:MAG TPA: molybdopterin dinucleotide binding domain-containing protein, partial [Tepidiformaceae bacterium]|nr:molybdopterin dinucleotide binding domain-containing protein [Tepidiformaceae bacterium]
ALGPQMRAVKAALEERLGTWRAAGDMTRLATSKTIVVVHDDLEESHNVASVRIKDAVVNNGAQLIVIGALRSELVDFAALWIRPAGGEEGLAAARLADALGGAQADNDEIAGAAEMLRAADHEQTIVVVAPNPVSPAVAASMAGGAANLAIALWGDAASENLVELPAEVNVHGLLDMGVGVSNGGNPLEGLAGLLVVRDDPTVRLPGAAAALDSIGTIVVVDDILHETAKRASVVIADGRAYGTAGTFTQGDYRVQRLQRAVRPLGTAVAGATALSGIAAGLGLEVPADPDAILGEIAKANDAYRPAYDLIVGEGVRLAISGSGKGKIVPLEALPVGDGIRVIAARDLFTALDAAMLRHPDAEKLHRYDRIQVSEQDAARLGISDYDEIELTDGRTTIRARASVQERVPEGHVFVSSLLQGGAVVNLFAEAAIPVVRIGVPVGA